MKNSRLAFVIIALSSILMAGCTLGSGGNSGPLSSAKDTSCSKGDGKSNKTATELLYEDLQICSGASVKAGQTVVVMYKSWVKDGSNQRLLKDTYDSQKPVTFKVGSNQVIPGLDQGVVGMQAGGKRRMILTPALGYGTAGNSSEGVPANATLVYEVEVLEIRQ